MFQTLCFIFDFLWYYCPVFPHPGHCPGSPLGRQQPGHHGSLLPWPRYGRCDVTIHSPGPYFTLSTPTYHTLTYAYTLKHNHTYTQMHTNAHTQMRTHHILWTGAIPWLMVAELFLQEARPIAVTIATIVNWLSNFAVALAFPQILVSHMTSDSQSKWVT